MFRTKTQFISCDNLGIRELFAEVARQISIPDLYMSIHYPIKITLSWKYKHRKYHMSGQTKIHVMLLAPCPPMNTV
jgi:hypothetical protein